MLFAVAVAAVLVVGVMLIHPNLAVVLAAAAVAEAVVMPETQEDVEEQADAALQEHQQHLTAYQ
jgi:ABC-type transport system involved in cytochrome bd biosynthesis fused ATPase/permease subunit